MINTKFKYLLAALVIVFFVLILLFILFIGRAPTDPGERLVSPTITSVPEQSIILPPGASEIFVDSFLPTQTELFYLPIQPIEIFFSTEIIPDDIKYSTSPLTEIQIAQGTSSKSIVIKPDGFWAEGSNVITIYAGEFESSGAFLLQDFVYRLNVGVPVVDYPHDDHTY